MTLKTTDELLKDLAMQIERLREKPTEFRHMRIMETLDQLQEEVNLIYSELSQ